MEKIKMLSYRNNRTTTPKIHISAFENHMVLYTMTDSVWYKAFPPTLEGLATEWHEDIRKGSVYSYNQLKRMFMEHFITLVDRTKMTNELMSLVQGKDEPLREFITRFNKEETTIPNMRQEVALLAMKSGLLLGSPFRAYMGRKSLKMLVEAHEFIKADETDRAMLSRKAPNDSVKRAKVTRAENAACADLPSRAKGRREGGSSCRGEKFKQHANLPKRRDEDRTGRDRIGGHRSPAEDKDKNSKLEGKVYVISGGPVHGGTVNKARTDLRAMIHQINYNEERRWPPLPPQPRATFDEYDLEGIIYPHDDPLVVMMRIANWEVDRILINDGSSANIIYISAFKELKLDRKDPKRVSYEVTGFNGSELTPEGIIELSV
ncbi:uncharacterized protein LOC110725232 [Chenopodium quinoa]|uniref:uncharacterized protein LOC110725232 n=1 Tax=Chenopodium quinoa TaxID=63459 RepID=UPI000B774379|nr:uncharacterized protein LOC110725232 [Chenopodium quinoa]